jgi:hypothetical protein
VVTEHGDDGQPQSSERVGNELPFLGRAVLREIAGEQQQIRPLRDVLDLVRELSPSVLADVNVADGSEADPPYASVSGSVGS